MSKDKPGYEGGVASGARKAEIIEAAKQKIHRFCDPIFRFVGRIQDDGVKSEIGNIVVDINNRILNINKIKRAGTPNHADRLEAKAVCIDLERRVHAAVERGVGEGDRWLLEKILHHIDQTILPYLNTGRRERHVLDADLAQRAEREKLAKIEDRVMRSQSEHALLLGQFDWLSKIQDTQLKLQIEVIIKRINFLLKIIEGQLNQQKENTMVDFREGELQVLISQLNGLAPGDLTIDRDRRYLNLLKEDTGPLISRYLERAKELFWKKKEDSTRQAGEREKRKEELARQRQKNAEARPGNYKLPPDEK